MREVETKPILLYDGVCGLCNHFVQFILARDHAARFRFASLQCPFAARVLRKHGVSVEALDTVYLVLNSESREEKLLSRSDAAVVVLRGLGGFWALTSGAVRALPRVMRDWVYNQIARRRYRIFGKYDACMLPAPKYRDRFLED